MLRVVFTTYVSCAIASERNKMNASALPMASVRFGDPGQPFLSARRVAESLGITLAELADLAGLARNTLTASSGARRVDAALGPIVRIIAIAGEMAGDETRAAIWFKHQPLPGWDGKTAADLVRENKAEKVVSYLEAVRAGVYA